MADLVADMRWNEIVSAVAESSMARPGVVSPLETLAELGPLTLAYSVLGRFEDMVTTRARGATLAELIVSSPPPGPIAGPSEAVSQFSAYSTVATVFHGEGWADLDHLHDHFTEWLVARDFHRHLTMMAGTRAFFAHAQGKRPLAKAEVRRALDGNYASGPPVTRSTLHTALARDLITKNELDEARYWMERVRAEQHDLSRWDEVTMAQAEAALAAAEGDTQTAVDLLTALAMEHAENSPVVAIVTGYEAMRLGSRDDGLLSMVEAAAEALPPSLPKALAGAARGWHDGDAHALNRERWAAQAKGRMLLARHIAEAAEDPASRERARPDEGDGLSRREQEIAQLAGAGMSNAEIASRLFLSVRTVESHLYSARRKTGAHSRAELGLLSSEPGETRR